MARSFGRGNRIRQAADTQREMNAAASTDESDARARMERALKEVRDHASTVLAFVHRSQRAWKAYFDAEVELRWPPNAGGNRGQVHLSIPVRGNRTRVPGRNWQM